ncbi:TetR/AcrR family transcriptional regulator [Sphingomonas sp. A2-49]|uniref:TetR/AcrR family transcriptional regulator n=1 Tax=Sphingomonas sp. A2-49 TaxID=1391375 RepID=UPI0021D3D03A|nr:TetR/AcrR family transcriptional regulator [Sphingomonas sp. A2-49]MCU6453906.1 TetR/AcrR family transcriptional regulator [Sphingomonas sp. A2-49]
MSATDPARPRSGGLRATLIDAALALMEETGTWRFSLREVARRAGVSHNAHVRHFADKAALLAAIGAAGYDALGQDIARAVSREAGAVDGLHALVRTFVGFALRNRPQYGLMVGKDVRAADGSIAPDLRRAADGARHVLKDLLDRGARAGVFTIDPDDADDLSAAVVAVWSMLHGYTLLELERLRQLETLIGTDELTERVSARLVNGLVAARPAQVTGPS